METLQQLLIKFNDWAKVNPWWVVGALLLIAALLAYFLNIRPRRKREEQQLYRKLQQEQSSADTAEKLRLQQEQNKASRKQAGTEYELMVAEKLLSEFSDWTSTGRAHLLYDVKIPNTQIDILLIDTSGIYIIECKRWKGLIVGKHSWPVWFQIDCKIVNNKPDVESPTYNADKYVSCKILPAPVEQNEIHMKKLQDFICDSGIREDLKFKRLSVMNSTGYLDFIQKDTDTQKNWIKNYIWLGKDEDIVSAIQDYDCRTLEATRMKPEQVEAIYQLLKPYAAAHDE